MYHTLNANATLWFLAIARVVDIPLGSRDVEARDSATVRSERVIVGGGVAQKNTRSFLCTTFCFTSPRYTGAVLQESFYKEDEVTFNPSFIFVIGVAKCRVPLSSSSARLVLVTC